MLAPRTLWREILSDRRLTSRPEPTILEHACQAHERAESLRQQILTAGELIETQTGGIKANPLLWSSYKPERCARGSSTSSFRMKASAVPAARRTSVPITDMLLPTSRRQVWMTRDRLFLPPTERRVAR